MTRDECIAFALKAGIKYGWARVMNSAAIHRAGVSTFGGLDTDELLDLVERLKTHARMNGEVLEMNNE